MTKKERNKDILIRRGDIFLSRNPMTLGKIINWFQSIQSVDKSSKYSHAGVVLNSFGAILEAVWSVKVTNLWDEYGEDCVLIARPINLSDEDINRGINIARKNIGKWYPFHRFIMMLIPTLARRVGGSVGVCSEETVRYLQAAGMDIDWKGKTPDNIHDMVKDSREWIIIYEGKI